MLHDLHFLILTCLHKIQSFSLALSSEVILIEELDLIALLLHTNATFFLLKFIFRVSFLFFLVYLACAVRVTSYATVSVMATVIKSPRDTILWTTISQAWNVGRNNVTSTNLVGRNSWCMFCKCSVHVISTQSFILTTVTPTI